MHVITLALFAFAFIMNASTLAAQTCSIGVGQTQDFGLDGTSEDARCTDATCIVSQPATVSAGTVFHFNVKVPHHYLFWLQSRSAPSDGREITLTREGAPSAKFAVSSGTLWHWDVFVTGTAADPWALPPGSVSVGLRPGKPGIVLGCGLLVANPKIMPGVAKTVALDRIWAGVAVPLGAVRHDNHIFVAYYDAHRWFTVADVDLVTDMIQRIRLPNQFAGWDAHKTTAIGVDENGLLHVAGDMHVTPLIYARSDKPWSLKGLDRLRPMTARNERHATYPTFVHLADGRLLFSHRVGKSGDGSFYLDLFDHGQWRPLFKGPFSTATWHGGTVNAYPSNFTMGPNHVIGTAIVWRGAMNAAANFKLSYVQTRDLIHWTTAGGRPVALPISPDEADIVDNVEESDGLLNNQKMAFDNSGAPIIAYSRYDRHGDNQVFLARWNGKEWLVRAITHWNARWQIGGGGTLPGNVEFTPPETRSDGLVDVQTTHWKFGTERWTIDPTTLTVVQASSPVLPLNNMLRVPDRKMGAGSARIEQIADSAGHLTPAYLLWHARRSTRDKAMVCDPRAGRPCPPLSSTLSIVIMR